MTRRIHAVCIEPGCTCKAICIDTRTRAGGVLRRRFKCENGHRFYSENDRVTRYNSRNRVARPQPKHVTCVYTGPILTEWRPNPFQGV